MKSKATYIGYYDGTPYCMSCKKKAVKKYMELNRKLSPDQYDIEVSYRTDIPDDYEDDITLVKIYDRYITNYEVLLISRDYMIFMDEQWESLNNLYTMLKVVDPGDKSTIKDTISIYETMYDDNDTKSEMFKRFCLNHMLMNMSMQELISKRSAFPNYFRTTSIFSIRMLQ